MKKKFVVGIITLISTMMLGACGNSAEVVTTNEEATSDVTEAVVSAESTEDEFVLTQLIMGFDANFPPYGYQDDNGEYVGFDIDLAEEVCNRLEITLIKQAIDWASKDMELESGAIDCIWNGFTLSEVRADAYTWTAPYVDNSQVFVVLADSEIKTIEDLAGKVVAVQAGSSAFDALNTDEGKEMVLTFRELLGVPDYNNAFMQLETGAADAVALDVGVANYQIESRGDGFLIMEEALATEVYAIGFLLGDTQLRDCVEATLMEMVEDGTFMEIATRWDLQDYVILGK